MNINKPNVCFVSSCFKNVFQKLNATYCIEGIALAITGHQVAFGLLMFTEQKPSMVG
jgi:hypothetical protein